MKADQQAKMPVQQPQAQPKAVQEQQVPVKPDPKAQKLWAEKNKWFGDNRVMTMAAFAINQQLIEGRGV